jgi:hypothetical protein
MTGEIREGTVEEEIAILAGEMKCMKAELGEERATPLSWDEITSTTTEELVRQEQRKAILLRLCGQDNAPGAPQEAIQTALHRNARGVLRAVVVGRPRARRLQKRRIRLHLAPFSGGQNVSELSKLNFKSAGRGTHPAGSTRMITRGPQGARDRKFTGEQQPFIDGARYYLLATATV